MQGQLCVAHSFKHASTPAAVTWTLSPRRIEEYKWLYIILTMCYDEFVKSHWIQRRQNGKTKKERKTWAACISARLLLQVWKAKAWELNLACDIFCFWIHLKINISLNNFTQGLTGLTHLAFFRGLETHRSAVRLRDRRARADGVGGGLCGRRLLLSGGVVWVRVGDGWF